MNREDYINTLFEENEELKAENERLKSEYKLLLKTSDLMCESCEKCSKELKAQIEKMKCCENCRWYNNMECNCHNLNKWELSD